MSTGITRKQHVDYHVHNEYEKLQDQILKKTGVQCSVLVTPEMISIRTASYADFVLARNAIKGQVSLPIRRDETWKLE